MSVGKREITTVPSQALFLMNSDFVRTQAEAMARRLLANKAIKPEHQGVAAFYQVYSRRPTDDEKRKASIYFKQSLELSKQEGAEESAYHQALTNFYHSLLSSADFLYIN